MIKRIFLSEDDRARLTGIARDGWEERRAAPRANAALLSDRGWSSERVSQALLLNDDTIRSWFRVYREGGVATSPRSGLAGGRRTLTVERLTVLQSRCTETLAASTRAIGQHIRTTSGVSSLRSGPIKLTAASDLVRRKPDLAPAHLEAQRDFAEQHEMLRNGPAIVGGAPFTGPVGRGPRPRALIRFIPSHCPHLNPIEWLRGMMHQDVTHDRYPATFDGLADAVLPFLEKTPSEAFQPVLNPSHRRRPHPKPKGLSGRRAAGVSLGRGHGPNMTSSE